MKIVTRGSVDMTGSGGASISNTLVLYHDRFLTPDPGYDPSSCCGFLLIPNFPVIFPDLRLSGHRR